MHMHAHTNVTATKYATHLVLALHDKSTHTNDLLYRLYAREVDETTVTQWDAVDQIVEMAQPLQYAGCGE